MTEAELSQILRITERANDLIKKIRQLSEAELDIDNEYYVYCIQNKITDEQLRIDCANIGIKILKEKFEIELRCLKLPGQIIETERKDIVNIAKVK